MRDKTSSSETAWQDEELANAALPDKRLARRLQRLLDQMSAAPGKPIPAACGDWAATKAAYRFFDNPRFVGTLRSWEARGAPAYGRLLMAAIVAGIDPDCPPNGDGSAGEETVFVPTAQRSSLGGGTADDGTV